MWVRTVLNDTLEELAEGLGLPFDAFLAQVERHNSYCGTGLDDEFHKDKRFLLPVKQPLMRGAWMPMRHLGSLCRAGWGKWTPRPRPWIHCE